MVCVGNGSSFCEIFAFESRRALAILIVQGSWDRARDSDEGELALLALLGVLLCPTKPGGIDASSCISTMTKEASPDLTVYVQQCLHNQTENGQISFQNGEAFANVVLHFTEVRHIWQKNVLIFCK